MTINVNIPHLEGLQWRRAACFALGLAEALWCASQALPPIIGLLKGICDDTNQTQSVLGNEPS